jgi:hypothetical protein
MKVKLIRPWSRAETDGDGRIVGWHDYGAGEVVEVSKSLGEDLIAIGTAAKVEKEPASKPASKSKKSKKK